jgi:hypothetical protein
MAGRDEGKAAAFAAPLSAIRRKHREVSWSLIESLENTFHMRTERVQFSKAVFKVAMMENCSPHVSTGSLRKRLRAAAVSVFLCRISDLLLWYWHKWSPVAQKAFSGYFGINWRAWYMYTILQRNAGEMLSRRPIFRDEFWNLAISKNRNLWNRILWVINPCNISKATRRFRVACDLILQVRFEVFTAVTMKNVIVWDMTPRDSCKNRRFGRKYRLHYSSNKNRQASNKFSIN